ncbi:hypothetical protein GCM10009560_79440 [Nonomuraea longicatena]|uniref:NUDIX hydrolase n=1 Tax=Nonomuraea longicatena TaxID=83682 RepID=A0ABN1RE72_9ACTN
MDNCPTCGNENPEPVEGAVILDRDGDVWQRQRDGWRMLGGGRGPRSWDYVTQTYGVRRILHTPEAA